MKEMQDAFNAFEECRKPVIAAIHGACIGGGIDMVTACDLRYCTQVPLYIRYPPFIDLILFSFHPTFVTLVCLCETDR